MSIAYDTARIDRAIDKGEHCLRCGDVPQVNYEDCKYGKEIEGAGTEPHIFPVEVWLNTDPRYSINKRADIVIIRPSILGCGHVEAGMGYVDTKEGWSIWTPFENHKFISADDNWDMDWVWTWAPRKREIK